MRWWCGQRPPRAPASAASEPPAPSRFPLPTMLRPRPPARPQAAQLAFDLPVYLNYWSRGGFCSEVCGSRPGYCLPKRPPTSVAYGGGEGRSPRVGSLAAPAESGSGTARIARSSPGTQGLAGLARGTPGKRLLQRSRSCQAGRRKAGARGELGCQTDSGETGKEERTSANTQGFCQAGWPEVEPRWAGSGLVELQRASHTLG